MKETSTTVSEPLAPGILGCGYLLFGTAYFFGVVPWAADQVLRTRNVPLTLLVVGAMVIAYFAPLAWHAHREKRNARSPAEAFTAFVKANGGEGELESAYFGDSGIAVDPARRVLYLSREGFHGAFAFDVVKGWKTHLVPFHEVRPTGGGGPGAASWRATAVNMRAEAKARAASGLFFELEHASTPLWQVRVYDAAELERWDGILKRAISAEVPPPSPTPPPS